MISEVEGENSHLKHLLTFTRSTVLSMQLPKKLTNNSNYNNDKPPELDHSQDRAQDSLKLSLLQTHLNILPVMQLAHMLTLSTTVLTDFTIQYTLRITTLIKEKPKPPLILLILLTLTNIISSLSIGSSKEIITFINTIELKLNHLTERMDL